MRTPFSLDRLFSCCLLEASRFSGAVEKRESSTCPIEAAKAMSSTPEAHECTDAERLRAEMKSIPIKKEKKAAAAGGLSSTVLVNFSDGGATRVKVSEETTAESLRDLVAEKIGLSESARSLFSIWVVDPEKKENPEDSKMKVDVRAILIFPTHVTLHSPSDYARPHPHTQAPNAQRANE